MQSLSQMMSSDLISVQRELHVRELHVQLARTRGLQSRSTMESSICKRTPMIAMIKEQQNQQQFHVGNFTFNIRISDNGGTLSGGVNMSVCSHMLASLRLRVTVPFRITPPQF